MELVVGSFTPSVLLAVARRTGLDERLKVTEVAVPSSPAQLRSPVSYVSPAA